VIAGVIGMLVTSLLTERYREKVQDESELKEAASF
jgi:hypothetical protein